MKRNRKTPKKMSVVAATTMRFGAIIVFFFVMVILNLLSASSCTHLLKAKGELERELQRLEDSRTRESARWEEMKSPDRVEAALVQRGLAMRMPHSDQVVRMRADGCLFPSQPSVAKARQRIGNIGQVSPEADAPTIRSRYRRRRSR